MQTKEIVFPIPISENRIVTINNLPVDLKKEDAAKICRVVTALLKIDNVAFVNEVRAKKVKDDNYDIKTSIKD